MTDRKTRRRVWKPGSRIPRTDAGGGTPGVTWIRKHVFPGGQLPSLGAMRSEAEAAGYAVEGVEDIGQHYATTLRRWRERLLARRAGAFALGIDERALGLWEYYFSYCEAGFATGVIHDFQLVLSRPAEATAP